MRLRPAGVLGFVVALAALALVLAASLAPAAGARVVMRADGHGGGAARFWTAERMERARPLELVRAHGGSTLERAPMPTPPPFDSGPVPDPMVPPLPTNGKVFGKLPGLGLFECSATVVSSVTRNVLLTAGHCVYEPRERIAATRLTFVPAYADGARPFGRWTVTKARAPLPWVKLDNFDYDYATMTVAPLNGALIEDVVGSRPLFPDGPRETPIYDAYGYPVNFDDAQTLWTCHSGYAGDDPRPIPGGPPPIGIGCDMKAGASGGGWIDELGRLVSVTSFGYNRRPGFLYGPYLTAKTARLVERSG